MRDSFESIVGEVHGHSQAVDPLLVQSWVRDTWREIAESRTWSWLRRKTTMLVPAPYSTGTVTLTPDSTTVPLTGGTVSEAWIGRQFRRTTSDPIYDITSVNVGAGTFEIRPAWNSSAAVVTAQAYRVFTAYLTPPDSDFFAFISVVNPNRRRRLRLHVNQQTIDYHDPNRTSTSSSPACLSGLDWTVSYSGKVYPLLQVVGSGPKPVASGTYTGSTDSLYVVKVTTGGALETARFSYQKDSTGTLYTGQVVSATPSTLIEGVELTWPTGTYILNDVFVIRVSPRPSYGNPRYELYPHHSEQLQLQATYLIRTPDIDEPGFVLPYTIPGNVIKTGAMAKMARYPGTEERPNPYAQLARAQHYEEEFGVMLGDLNTQDEYIIAQNVLDGHEVYEEQLLPWMNGSGMGMRATAEYDPFDVIL